MPRPPGGRHVRGDLIRVKAFTVLPNTARTHHAVWRSRDVTKDSADFHRLLGGHVEFGERAADAVVREIGEELGTALIDPVLLGVVENVFRYEGRPSHEIVFVFGGSIDERVIPADGAWFDDGGPIRVEWRRVRDRSGIPPYPLGTQRMLEEWLSR